MTARRAWGFEGGEDTWRSRAACRPVGGRPVAAPAMDTTDPGEAAPLIRRYCRTCPVSAQCHAEASELAAGTGKLTDAAGKPWGVWGGLVWVDGRPRRAPTGDSTRENCGTRGGHEAHRRNGEDSCLPCWQAEANRKKAAA